MDKSQISNEKKLTVLLLCWLFGLFGVHRFYIGKRLTGCAQLVTLILFGVFSIIDIGVIAVSLLIGLSLWIIVDAALIVMGKFTDKEGRPIVDWV
jgi:TM2 domain-containing membrane protein YozV